MATGGVNILVVEDMEINRKLVGKMLAKFRLSFDEAENGEVAVEYFRQGRKYDLVLMDKEMPVMDGHEATRQLRALGVTTPIVALSGNASEEDVDEFLRAGADGFHTKPITQEGLLGVLEAYGLLRLKTEIRS